MIARKPLPSLETLNSLLLLDAEAGRLVWKERPIEMFGARKWCLTWNKRYAGTYALEAVSSLGYKFGSIGNKVYLAHRVIYKMHFGVEPDIIDHLNRNPLDNRPENLRDGSQLENMQNKRVCKRNKSGIAGISPRNNTWVVRKVINGKRIYIGRLKTFELAVAELLRAEAGQ